MEFKKDFVDKYSLFLEDIDEFLEYSKKRLRKSIRVNTIKITNGKLVKMLEKRGWELERVPWHENGYFIKTNETVGKTMEHSLGYFYVQEAASMLPPLDLDLKQDDTVLDMAASPGSKTTQMGMILDNTGLIVANDININKITALASNTQRCGLLNTIITKTDGRRFSRFRDMFDKILLDAPCSGTGAIRKSWKIIDMWNPEGIKGLAMKQKSLIMAAYRALKPNGIMVYSTCTLEPEENEEVIQHLLENTDAKIEKTRIRNIKTRKGLTSFQHRKYSNELKKTNRVYPQDNDTEGFYWARIRK